MPGWLRQPVALTDKPCALSLPQEPWWPVARATCRRHRRHEACAASQRHPLHPSRLQLAPVAATRLVLRLNATLATRLDSVSPPRGLCELRLAAALATDSATRLNAVADVAVTRLELRLAAALAKTARLGLTAVTATRLVLTYVSLCRPRSTPARLRIATVAATRLVMRLTATLATRLDSVPPQSPPQGLSCSPPPLSPPRLGYTALRRCRHEARAMPRRCPRHPARALSPSLRPPPPIHPAPQRPCRRRRRHQTRDASRRRIRPTAARLRLAAGAATRAMSRHDIRVECLPNDYSYHEGMLR
jgi:hypothetical protein